MTTYVAPIRDMRFVLEDLCGIDRIAQLPGLEDTSPDVVWAVLEEAARMSEEVLAPINQQGDREGSILVDGAVRTPSAWKKAYRIFIDGGWNGAAFDPEYGGMGLPWTVNSAAQEMFHAANMSFSVCALLNQGAIEAISLNGSNELKTRFLPKMVSGEWTGTMNLTEPQAGSDLGAVRTRAEKRGDHYVITGQKMYITYGDHDLTENIIHLLLARTADAPPGVKGISMFVVPKVLVGDDGSLLERNDIQCVSLEHKLGLHASPTALLAYGENGGAVGYLVGEENRGLAYMFVMMNMARLAVGIQGLAIAERAYQQARAYALERIQGHPPGFEDEARVPIIEHPDVRRMLMTMKASIEAMRAVAYDTARSVDFSHSHGEPAVRDHHQRRVEFLTPIVKGWLTELSVELTSLGLQVHGGMGYIEDTGASQHYRDARVTTIYEGTTAIQANDLVGRKIVRDGGAVLRGIIADIRALEAELAATADPTDAALGGALTAGGDALAEVGEWILEVSKTDPRQPAAVAVPTLRLVGTVVGGYQMAHAAIAARTKLATHPSDADFLEAKIATARFYAEQIMPQVNTLVPIIVHGSQSVLSLRREQF